MTKIYCVSCRDSTNTVGEKKTFTSNGRPCLKGQCADCGTNKTRFLPGEGKPVAHKKKMKGEGIKDWLNNMLNSNKLPEMHLRGFSGKYNFAGPFTKLDKRIDPVTKEPLPHSKPINRIDQSALNHDRGYDMLPDKKSRHIMDQVMIDDMSDIIKDKNTNWRERFDARIVKGAIGLKKFLGMGKKKKRGKKRDLKGK